MDVLIISNNAAGLLNLRRELIQALVQMADVYICVPPDSYSNQITDVGGNLIETAFERRGKSIQIIYFFIIVRRSSRFPRRR